METASGRSEVGASGDSPDAEWPGEAYYLN